MGNFWSKNKKKILKRIENTNHIVTNVIKNPIFFQILVIRNFMQFFFLLSLSFCFEMICNVSFLTNINKKTFDFPYFSEE